MRLSDFNPWSLMQQLRRRCYAAVLPRRSFENVRVVVVGALHVGGVGKTPVTLALAQKAIADGKRVGILSRGYGRKSGTGPVWVSEGRGPQVSVEEAGDELWWLSENCPQALALACASRVTGVHWLRDRGAEVIFCDDGFQHLALKADETHVLLPSYPDEYDTQVVPFGRLREPLTALLDADHVWVEENALNAWQVLLKTKNIAVKTLRTYRRGWAGFHHQDQWLSVQQAKQHLQGSDIHAVVGLGRADLFEMAWEKHVGLPVTLCAKRDHQASSPKKIADLNGAIVVTEKDWVKLNPRLNKNDPLRQSVWIVRESVELPS